MAGRSLRFPFLLLLATLTAVGCIEEGDITISSLTFNGVSQVDKGQLQNSLQTRRGSRLPWGRKRYFDRRAFEADLKRLEAFYRDRGFPDARVTSFDVKLNDTQRKVDVTVNITEGEPVRVAGVELRGFDVLPDDARDNLLQGLPLQPKAPLDRQLALASRERVMNVLRDHGYFYAEVALTEEAAGSKQTTVVVTATPGPLTHVGPIEIAGTKSVGEEVVRRQLTFEPGDVYRRSALRESQRQIYRLELFEFVNVEPRPDGAQQTADTSPGRPTDIPTRVTVAEGKHQRLTMGVGYGSEERARARLRWEHVNFLGGARHAGFEGKWSLLDRGVKLDLTEPYLLSRQLSLRFDGQAWQAEEPLYDLDSVGGRVTLQYQPAPQNKMSVALINEYQRSRIENEALQDLTIRDELISLGLDPRTDLTTGTLSAIAFDVSRNTSDNLLDARRGYSVSAHLEQAGRWLQGSYNFWSMTAEGRHYLSLGRRAVFANRLRIGTINPTSGEERTGVPFYRRFFLGGSSSLRGWGRLEVGPLSGSGLPIGGHTMLEGSTEVRVPVWGKLGAVGFVDYGNVWPGSWDFQLSDMRYAIGPGLRYLTPVGPARVDVGFQLTPYDTLLVNGVPEPRHLRIHFSIGQSF